jgi:hypothetical protein
MSTNKERWIIGKFSRDKGARMERALRDELTRLGWSDVLRVPLSGAMRGYKGDVIGTPPGKAESVNFELKARATGFDSIYSILPPSVDRICVSVGSGDLVALSLDVNKCIESATFADITTFAPDRQKILLSVIKKCRDWIGDAQILSLKQDYKPFIYAWYRK